MVKEENKKMIIEIGNKHGLMMHDPIQSYHIGNAMQEYAESYPSELRKENEELKKINKMQAEQWEYWKIRCGAAEVCAGSFKSTTFIGLMKEKYEYWQTLKSKSI